MYRHAVHVWGLLYVALMGTWCWTAARRGVLPYVSYMGTCHWTGYGFWPLCLNPFTPTVIYGDIKVVLTSESVDEILWCDHSNETSSAVLSHGTIYI